MTTITTNERLANDLENTFTQLLQSFDAIPLNKFNHVPFEGSWTPGQLADHLYKSYAGTDDMRAKSIATDRPADIHCESIKNVFLDFNQKYKAEPFLVPGKGPFNREETLLKLKQQIEKVLHFFQQNDLTKIYPDFELPGWGALTLLEWGTLMLYHTQRHIRQLDNMKKNIQ